MSAAPGTGSPESRKLNGTGSVFGSLATKGTDYDLAPKAGRKVPLVATIYAEADGTPLPQPDPADTAKREFAWMTAHKYTADRVVSYPFKDWRTLGK